MSVQIKFYNLRNIGWFYFFLGDTPHSSLLLVKFYTCKYPSWEIHEVTCGNDIMILEISWGAHGKAN